MQLKAKMTNKNRQKWCFVKFKIGIWLFINNLWHCETMTHMWQFVNVCHICDRIDRKAPERFFVQEIKCSFSFSALLEAVFAAARSRRWIIKPIINAMKLPFMVYSTLCQRVQSKVNGLKEGKLTVLHGDGHEKMDYPSRN